MAKGTAECTCKVCGKKFEKEFYGSSRKDVDSKIEWAENGGIDTCPECYKAQKRAEEAAKGLVCVVRLGTRNEKIYAIFEGDTYNHREQLKAEGCKWTDKYPKAKHIDNILGDIVYDDNKKDYRWVYVSEDFEAVKKIVKATGAKTTWPTKEDIAVHVAVNPQDNTVAPVASVAPKAKKEKKLTVDGAVYRLGQASTKKDLTAVFEKCTVQTLKALAKAFEPDMGVKVLSKFRRAELIDILSNHNDWLLQMTSYSRQATIEERVNQFYKIKALKASKTEQEWTKAWNEVRKESLNFQRRALMACTKKTLVAYLNPVTGAKYTTKQCKTDIVDNFMNNKVAA